MVPKRDSRAGVLASFGASPAVIEELLAFDQSPQEGKPPVPFSLPLPPEPHVQIWREYAAEAEEQGAWEVLRRRLPQLQFPVQEGISQTEAYRTATLRDTLPGAPAGPGLALNAPDRLRLWVHDSLAGPIPVLCIADRGDFVLLVQALACRSEPLPVPDSMGACIVTGFNNLDRIRGHRDRWLAGRTVAARRSWPEEFRRITSQKELYQDRFLILTEGPYSNVGAVERSLLPEEWLRVSHTIRLAHECTHYLTLRLFGAMRAHPLDELIADYVGVAAGFGCYRRDWALRFLGLEDFPKYRSGGRLENYRGRPPLSDAAFKVVAALVQAAAETLERIDQRFALSGKGQDRLVLAPALFQATLEELASSDGDAFFQDWAKRNGP